MAHRLDGSHVGPVWSDRSHARPASWTDLAFVQAAGQEPRRSDLVGREPRWSRGLDGSRVRPGRWASVAFVRPGWTGVTLASSASGGACAAGVLCSRGAIDRYVHFKGESGVARGA